MPFSNLPVPSVSLPIIFIPGPRVARAAPIPRIVFICLGVNLPMAFAILFIVLPSTALSFLPFKALFKAVPNSFNFFVPSIITGKNLLPKVLTNVSRFNFATLA